MKVIDIRNGRVIRDSGVEDSMTMYVNGDAWSRMMLEQEGWVVELERKFLYGKKNIKKIEII